MPASFILISVLVRLLTYYSFVIIIAAFFSLAVGLGILKTHNKYVWQIGRFLEAVTEPVLAPVRRILPTPGGLDFSPLVILILIYILQDLLIRLAFYLL